MGRARAFRDYLQDIACTFDAGYGIPEFVADHVTDVSSVRRFSDNETIGFEILGEWGEVKFRIYTYNGYFYAYVPTKDYENMDYVEEINGDIAEGMADYYFDLLAFEQADDDGEEFRSRPRTERDK